MQPKINQRRFTFFFLSLVVSFLGNACADYALLWYGISKSVQANTSSSSVALTTFYVGQALGVIVLAPILAIFFDKRSKLVGSIGIDVLYAAVLVGMILVYRYKEISSFEIFVFSLLTTALSLLHRSSVGFAAIQKMAKEVGLTKIVARFFIAQHLPILLGAAISGIVYKLFGFEGCMAIGILTFVPMFFTYFLVFSDAEREEKSGERFHQAMLEGFRTLLKERPIFLMGISIAILNIVSAVFPAIVGISFEKTYPGRSDLFTMSISVAILLGLLSIERVGLFAKRLNIRAVIPLSLAPALAVLLICGIYPHPILVAFAFAMSCVGSNGRNVTTGSLRVKRIPPKLIGRVNTAYSAILYVGQIFGGLIIIPVVQHDFGMGLWAISVVFVLSSLVSVIFLPNVSTKELVS